eukprot:maker-scaffold_23-snap-gene-4.54-mRNA-1 protein AED:0.02 eAED:0.02 QI:45/1/1/1/0.83/0.85/7/48/237
MMKSIQQQYEEKWRKTSFSIHWERDHNKNPITPNQFKREMEEFVKGFQLNKEVSFVRFRDCPFYAVESAFTRFILCFPAVKELRFWNCRFSDENFQNFQQLKILKLSSLMFTECNIPEVSSFCSLLSSINTKDIGIYENKLSAKYTYIIYKCLSFNKTILRTSIDEDVQNKVIVSAIKNYLKANKTIKSLVYSGYYVSKKIEEEDIIELLEIVASHPSILSLQVYNNIFKPKKKIKC